MTLCLSSDFGLPLLCYLVGFTDEWRFCLAVDVFPLKSVGMKCVSIVAIQMAVCQTRSVGALLERRPGRGPHVSHSGTPPVVELVVGLVDIGTHVEVSGVGGRQSVQGVPGLVTNLVIL